MRELEMVVAWHMGKTAAMPEHVLSQFEGFCTFTQTVSQGAPIRFFMVDADGVLLKS